MDNTKAKIEFYFMEGKINMAVLEVDGQKHYSSDVRTWSPTHVIICISRKTLPDKYNNEEETRRLVDMEILTKVEVEANIEIQRDYITHIYVEGTLKSLTGI